MFETQRTGTTALAPGAPQAHRRADGLLLILGFILLQFVCQIALLFEALSPVRVVVRSACFGASLALLVSLPGRSQAHPARPWVLAILAVVGVALLHPTGNTMLARVAQFGLYLAILAPLFWISRLSISVESLRRVLMALWSFHTLGSVVGVLQVYFPGSLQPNLSTVVTAQGQGYVNDLQMSLADGTKVFRPMGLTDLPGGAAMSGMYAVLFSLGFFFSTRSWLVRGVALTSMFLGLFCVYLSQVRSVLIMTGICVMAFAVLLGRRGDLGRVAGLALLAPVIAFVTYDWAESIGGRTVTKRVESLGADRVDQVYYKNRGRFLEHTINELLPAHPFGAGLGRWGMMYNYFGDNRDPNSGSIWVEIQLTGWLLDGGLPLILCYTVALITTCLVAYRISIHPRMGQLGLWATLILAYDIGAVALTFNYPLFIGQGGLEFWVLNACLYGAAMHAQRAIVSRRAHGAQPVPEPMGIKPVPGRSAKPA